MRLLGYLPVILLLLSGCPTLKGAVETTAGNPQDLTVSQGASMDDQVHSSDPSAGAVSASGRIALVIGNKDYAVAPLKNPIHDASDIRDALKAVGFDVIYLENADITGMNRAVRAFRSRIQPGGVAMVYYSGHGAQADGINYLIPVGADIQSTGELKARAYDADILVSEMTEAGSNVNILILDACRNNPFLSMRGTSGGLATMTASKGTIIAFATSPGSVADDNGRAQNGLYTHYLKAFMARKGMKIEDVFKKVRAEVVRVNPRQIPWESSSLIGDFCLAGCDDVTSAPFVAEGDKEIKVQKPLADAGEKTGVISITSTDLQKGRCVVGIEGEYRCMERSHWESIGRPNLAFAADLRGEAGEIAYCANLPGENAEENRCLTKDETLKALKRCVPAGENAYVCHSVDYWLKSILDSNLSASMATQSYTNEPLERPDLFVCEGDAGSDLRCQRRTTSDAGKLP